MGWPEGSRDPLRCCACFAFSQGGLACTPSSLVHSLSTSIVSVRLCCCCVRTDKPHPLLVEPDAPSASVQLGVDFAVNHHM